MNREKREGSKRGKRGEKEDKGKSKAEVIPGKFKCETKDKAKLTIQLWLCHLHTSIEHSAVKRLENIWDNGGLHGPFVVIGCVLIGHADFFGKLLL